MTEEDQRGTPEPPGEEPAGPGVLRSQHGDQGGRVSLRTKERRDELWSRLYAKAVEPVGPFRSESWRSPIRGPWLTSVFGSILLVGIPVMVITGLVSYAAYNPRLPGNRGHQARRPYSDLVSPVAVSRRARTALRPRSTRFEPAHPLEGVPPLVSAFVHQPVSLAGPGPSGGAEPSRRCQGCSHPARCLPGQAALSFSDLLRQAEGGSFHPTRLYGASWRTEPVDQSFTVSFYLPLTPRGPGGKRKSDRRAHGNSAHPSGRTHTKLAYGLRTKTETA